jgi:hypothetical protein
MFKFKLDSLDGLSDEHKALYEKKGDKFVLKVEGLEDGDVAGLKTKNETLLADIAKLKDKVKENDEAAKTAAEAARRAAEDAAAKKGDIEALRKSADERIAAARAEVEAQYKPIVERQAASIRKDRIENVAIALAAKIGLKGSESLLIPHITNRLAIEERDGDFVTVVRDTAGKASAASLDDLEKEFVGNPAFAPVIAGSKATGSGAGGSTNKGGGAAGAKTVSRAAFDTMPQHERMKFSKEGGQVTD